MRTIIKFILMGIGLLAISPLLFWIVLVILGILTYQENPYFKYK